MQFQHPNNQICVSHEPFDGSALPRHNLIKRTHKRHPRFRISNRPKQKTSHILNLSDTELTEYEISVLEKGLLFIPSPYSKPTTFQDSIDKYSRAFRLEYMFGDKEGSDINPFKPKSKFNPPNSGNQTLESFLTLTSQEISDLLSLPSLPTTKNLSKSEIIAIKNLKQKRNEIIIRSADKGSTVTIQSVTKYIVDGLKHLEDVTTYQPLDEDPTPSLAGNIANFVIQIFEAGYIDDIERDFLFPPDPVRTQFMYFLYKIHKTPIAVRPIVSGLKGPTVQVSKYLDYFFKPQVRKIKSYIGNSDHVIKCIKTVTLTPGSLLISIDVKNLYTTIPQEEGINAILRYNNLIGLPPYVTRMLLNFVLKNNIFSFNGQIYKQKVGIAMGTPLAPTLANIFMEQLEEDFLQTCILKPTLYKRYIDDILIVWPHSLADFNSFFDRLNSFHPTIKFTCTISETNVDYLDLNIFIDKNSHSLQTKTHLKATNTFQYVHYKSNHPLATKKAIIKGELLRYKRQCSKIEDFVALKQKLYDHFLERGYPFRMIKESISEVMTPIQKQRHSAFTKVFPFIISYDNRRHHPKPALVKHMNILSTNINTSRLAQSRPIVAYKNMKNINQIIARNYLDADKSNTSYEPSSYRYHLPQLVSKCGMRNCKSCTGLYTRNTFKCTATKKRIPIQSRLSCLSYNIIYVLQCPVCNLQYVGQTRSSLKSRINHHILKFNDKRTTPRQLLYQHFDRHLGCFRPIIIPLTKADPVTILETENHWINTLNTTIPLGLNNVWT